MREVGRARPAGLTGDVAALVVGGRTVAASAPTRRASSTTAPPSLLRRIGAAGHVAARVDRRPGGGDGAHQDDRRCYLTDVGAFLRGRHGRGAFRSAGSMAAEAWSA